MPERASQEPSPASHRRGLGSVADKARAHKLSTIAIAVAGFLGFGGIFGQWVVDRTSRAIQGESPPAGFEELYAAWQDTARLNNHFFAAGREANNKLEGGTLRLSYGLRTGRGNDLKKIDAVDYRASGLLGQVSAIDTDLAGPRDDLARLIRLVRETAQQVERAVRRANTLSAGEPMEIQGGAIAPIYSSKLVDAAHAQDVLVRQVAGGLAPTAKRFERAVPKFREWIQLAYPYEGALIQPGPRLPGSG
jgi:hypothetical protein